MKIAILVVASLLIANQAEANALGCDFALDKVKNLVGFTKVEASESQRDKMSWGDWQERVLNQENIDLATSTPLVRYQRKWVDDPRDPTMGAWTEISSRTKQIDSHQIWNLVFGEQRTRMGASLVQDENEKLQAYEVSLYFVVQGGACRFAGAVTKVQDKSEIRSSTFEYPLKDCASTPMTYADRFKKPENHFCEVFRSFGVR